MILHLPLLAKAEALSGNCGPSQDIGLDSLHSVFDSASNAQALSPLPPSILLFDPALGISRMPFTNEMAVQKSIGTWGTMPDTRLTGWGFHGQNKPFFALSSPNYSALIGWNDSFSGWTALALYRPSEKRGAWLLMGQNKNSANLNSYDQMQWVGSSDALQASRYFHEAQSSESFDDFADKNIEAMLNELRDSEDPTLRRIAEDMANTRDVRHRLYRLLQIPADADFWVELKKIRPELTKESYEEMKDYIKHVHSKLSALLSFAPLKSLNR